MPYYLSRGRIPRKRHVQFRSEAGELYHEELMGIRGFSDAQSLLYHLRPPTRVSEATLYSAEATPLAVDLFEKWSAENDQFIFRFQ